MDYYKLASELRNIEYSTEEMPDTYLNLQIDFIPFFYRIKENTEQELKKIGLNENVIKNYWGEFIQCFVKIMPKNEYEDCCIFRSEKHVFATITEIYSRDIFTKKLNEHYEKWNVEKKILK